MNDLANQRFEVGDRTGALTAITEAVTLYREVAQDNPAAITPNLATSTSIWAGLAPKPHGVWRASCEVVPAPARALILLRAHAWFAERGAAHEDAWLTEAITSAAEESGVVPVTLLGEIRRLVRDIARSQNSLEPLPDWIIREIPDAVTSLAEEWWTGTHRPVEVAAALETHHETLHDPATGPALEVLAFLCPEAGDLTPLQDLAGVPVEDLTDLATSLRQRQRTIDAVTAWVQLPTWSDTI